MEPWQQPFRRPTLLPSLIVTFDWETMKTTLACLFALLTPAFGLAGRPKDQWMLEKPEISLQLSS